MNRWDRQARTSARRRQFFQREARLWRDEGFIEVFRDDSKGITAFRDVEMTEEIAYVVEVVKFGTLCQYICIDGTLDGLLPLVFVDEFSHRWRQEEIVGDASDFLGL